MIEKCENFYCIPVPTQEMDIYYLINTEYSDWKCN